MLFKVGLNEAVLKKKKIAPEQAWCQVGILSIGSLMEIIHGRDQNKFFELCWIK